MRQDENKEPVVVEEAFNRLMDKLDEVKKETVVKTVVLDGLTHINEFIIRNILGLQRRTKSPFEMELRDWIPFKSKAYQLLVGKLQNLGKTTVCLCHEKILTEQDKTDLTKERVIGYQPAFQGGVTDYFGGFFTDMWRCECNNGPADRLEYIVKTRKTTKSDLKCSIPDMPSEIDITKGAELLLQYLKGKI